MDCSMPGFPVQHQIPELAQTHVHQVGDAIQRGYNNQILVYPTPAPVGIGVLLQGHFEIRVSFALL